MPEDLRAGPTFGRTIGWGRVVASTIWVAGTLAIFLYLFDVASGRVGKDSRLGASEIGLGLVAGLIIILVAYPSALDRLNLLKLPGGIELTLEKIQNRQIEQGREIDVSFRILSNLLTLPEKSHLRTLGRSPGPSSEYAGCDSLRQELWRLKRFGLIDEVEGQKIGDMYDQRQFSLHSFVALTAQGEKFIKALSQIEA